MSTKNTNPKDAIGARKVALSLLSPVAKAAWSAAQYLGAVKYGAFNWRVAGVRMTVYLDAIDRHRDAILSGEWYDPVDGTIHLGNIMACCAIILDAKAAGKLVDDRPPSVDHRPAYAETEAIMARNREQYAHLDPRHYTIADTERPKPPVVFTATFPLPPYDTVVLEAAAAEIKPAWDRAIESGDELAAPELDDDAPKCGAV